MRAPGPDRGNLCVVHQLKIENSAQTDLPTVTVQAPFEGETLPMTMSTTLVSNKAVANADLRFVSADLVALDARGAPHLIGGRCRKCQALSFPRAVVCTDCLSEDIETVHLATEGMLYSYSVVHQAPKGWAVPYVLGYIDLADKVRVLTHIDVAPEKIAIGMPMRLAVGVVGADASGAPLSSYTFTAI